MEYSVYMGSVRIARVTGAPRLAWRAARAYVRGMAHADGVHGAERIYKSGGRVVVERGIFHALPTALPV